MNDTIFMFLVILTTSFIFSIFLTRIPFLRIPTTVSYLLFGMILQTGLFNLTVQETDWLNHLADFGLLFLMYISGLEVDVHHFYPQAEKKSKNNLLISGITLFCSTLLLSFIISWCISKYTPSPTNPYMLALLFSTTSLGVILPILEESQQIHSKYGQTLLISALIADFLTMLLLSLFISSKTSGSPSQILLTLSILPFSIILYFLFRILQKLTFFRTLAGDVQTRIRAIIALLAITCAMADFTGAEPILGSFLIGILVSALPFALKSKLKDYSHGIGYGFFIPLFFISVGLDFNFKSMSSSHSEFWIPILILVAFIVKVVPALHLTKTFGIKSAIAGGCLLSARLSLIAAAAQIGVRIHMMSSVLADDIILIAIVTSLLSPILFVTLTQKPPLQIVQK